MNTELCWLNLLECGYLQDQSGDERIILIFITCLLLYCDHVYTPPAGLFVIFFSIKILKHLALNPVAILINLLLVDDEG
jgi:hypothetical protein